MKVIICRSREFNDSNFLNEHCLEIISREQYKAEIALKDIEIVSGNNPKGADYLGEKFAKQYNISLKLFPPDWTNQNPKRPDNWGSGSLCVWKPDYYGGYNALAGYIRNQEMANHAIGGICIVFDADSKSGSSGTRDMIRRAKKAWMKLYHVKCHDLGNVEIKVYNEGLQK